ncbi:MAG TPA: thioredoxin family protein, partial [Candidatus Absconditabacterales bacterium]|nr:thioredoxin family protein [Candidatus Absconditabacterales bacterium]
KDNMMKDETIMKDTGIYTTYAEDAVKAALAEGKKVVLFFHAARCPACVSADKEITATTLPENSVIFKVNYDTATDLKKSYGVTSQHTYVFLGSDMQATNKKVGLATSDAIAMLK